MIRLALFTSLVFLIIFSGNNVQPGLCEEKCPLVVTDWTPKGTIEYGRPTISAHFKSECGIDIDISSIEMLLEGSPVPFKVSGKGSEVTVSYTPEEDQEMDIRYPVTVRARDVKGNKVEKKWRYYHPFHY